MKRMDAAVALLDLLDRRRAETHDATLGKVIERDLVYMFIHDLDPERDIVVRVGCTMQSRLAANL
jgi:hypothetical protein